MMVGQLFVKRIIGLFFPQKETDKNAPQISELQKKLSKDKVNYKGLGDEKWICWECVIGAGMKSMKKIGGILFVILVLAVISAAVRVKLTLGK